MDLVFSFILLFCARSVTKHAHQTWSLLFEEAKTVEITAN